MVPGTPPSPRRLLVVTLCVSLSPSCKDTSPSVILKGLPSTGGRARASAFIFFRGDTIQRITGCFMGPQTGRVTLLPRLLPLEAAAAPRPRGWPRELPEAQPQHPRGGSGSHHVEPSRAGLERNLRKTLFLPRGSDFSAEGKTSRKTGFTGSRVNVAFRTSTQSVFPSRALLERRQAIRNYIEIANCDSDSTTFWKRPN